jgi:hypothetical protein
MTLLKTLLALTRLDPIVEELFVSLGDPLPEGRRLNHHRMKKLVRLPKNEQWIEARQLIEEAAIDHNYFLFATRTIGLIDQPV